MVPELLKAMEALDGTHPRMLSTNFLGLKDTATLAADQIIAPMNPNRLAIWIEPVEFAPYVPTGVGQLFIGPYNPQSVNVASMPILTILEDLTDPTLNASFQYIIRNLYWHAFTHGNIVQYQWGFVANSSNLDFTFNVWELVQTIPCPCDE